MSLGPLGPKSKGVRGGGGGGAGPRRGRARFRGVGPSASSDVASARPVCLVWLWCCCVAWWVWGSLRPSCPVLVGVVRGRCVVLRVVWGGGVVCWGGSFAVAVHAVAALVAAAAAVLPAWRRWWSWPSPPGSASRASSFTVRCSALHLALQRHTGVFFSLSCCLSCFALATPPYVLLGWSLCVWQLCHLPLRALERVCCNHGRPGCRLWR